MSASPKRSLRDIGCGVNYMSPRAAQLFAQPGNPCIFPVTIALFLCKTGKLAVLVFSDIFYLAALMFLHKTVHGLYKEKEVEVVQALSVQEVITQKAIKQADFLFLVGEDETDKSRQEEVERFAYNTRPSTFMHQIGKEHDFANGVLPANMPQEIDEHGVHRSTFAAFLYGQNFRCTSKQRLAIRGFFFTVHLPFASACSVGACKVVSESPAIDVQLFSDEAEFLRRCTSKNQMPQEFEFEKFLLFVMTCKHHIIFNPERRTALAKK